MNQPKTNLPGNETYSDNRVLSAVQGTCLTIHVEGRFDFNCHRDFRKAYEGVTGPITIRLMRSSSTTRTVGRRFTGGLSGACEAGSGRAISRWRRAC